MAALTVRAVFENGVFRPVDKVDLPEHAQFEFEPRPVVNPAHGAARENRTTEELLEPFRRQVQESGLTDDELDKLFDEAREEVWREKQGKHP